MKYLIAGLGNPGPQYELTRHNIGFLAADRLVARFDEKFSSSRFADTVQLKYKGRTIHVIKPMTFMNLSGRAVVYYMQKLKIGIENTAIITDDLALPFGKLRLRKKGASGGHNGLADIESRLGASEYPRFRLGIGNEFPKGGQVDYVLSNFSEGEISELPGFLDKVCDAVESFCTEGIERAMNKFN